MGAKQDERFFEQAKLEISELVSQAGAGASDDKTARQQAKEALEDYQAQARVELKQAAERFTILQRIEFIIGAAVVLQVVIFLLVLKGESTPLFVSSFLTFALYIVAAVFDSRAKGRRQGLHIKAVLAKKTKLKNTENGVVADFE